MIRVDLHLHSSYSHDGWAAPCEVVERAIAVGLDKVAITDHDEITGALEARSHYPGQAIVGEEINCGCGTHLIGLFLTERIVPGLSVAETAERIRDQGGVVYAPHPFAYARRPAWHAERALAVADVVEVFNSRAFFPPWNRKASAAARQRALPHLASSDAHFPWELGRAYTQLPSFSYAKGFLDSAPYGQSIGLRIGTPFVHVASVMVAQVRTLTGWQPGKTRSSHAAQIAGAKQRSV
jgi:predicted metal-dependent phosphoesterase TrpH